ncbi:hypothetical protein BBJ28_00004061 [Nothophytophthora sp. Chile5]|nr:hypothetical protein BBJ28_00004061 [Nothophytophthora sp. Chile5]
MEADDSCADPPPPKPKETRAHLTLEQKARLRAFLLEHPKLPQFAVSDWVREHFHVKLARSTLYRIQHAPEASFALGNLSRKKLRRVKFPDFEQQLLAFYRARRLQKKNVSDEALMRQAAECRAACGISDAQLKLSNGWLYRFKARHQLVHVPPLSGAAIADAEAAKAEGADDNEAAVGIEQRSGNVVATAITAGAVDDQQLAVFEEAKLPANESNEWEAAGLSARALSTVQAPGVLNWEAMNERQQQHFTIVSDGILVQETGLCDIRVRMQHSAPMLSHSPSETSVECVFKVFSDDRVVGQCDAPAHVHNEVASSLWEAPSLQLSAQTVLRVEFLAPGYAFTDSSLVLRWKGKGPAAKAAE